MLEVVVLPCVPATEMTLLLARIFLPNHSGPEVYVKPWLRIYSMISVSLVMTLPITIRSGDNLS